MSIDQGHIDFALKDAAKHYGCSVSDLEWKSDKFGAIHIRKKEERRTLDKLCERANSDNPPKVILNKVDIDNAVNALMDKGN